jgi:hypothetical protein
MRSVLFRRLPGDRVSDAISDTARFVSLRQGYRIGDHLWRGLLLVWRRVPPLRLQRASCRRKVDGAYLSGLCRVWTKVRNPASIAAQREVE